MKDEEAKNHPHLLMLDEFDGEIDGELKYQKVLYKYRVNALEEEDWGFTRERWGPTDPGFTEIMQSLDDLDLTELDKDDRIHIFWLTEGGKEVAGGLKRGLSKLDPGFKPRIQTILGLQNLTRIAQAQISSETRLSRRRKKRRSSRKYRQLLFQIVLVG